MLWTIDSASSQPLREQIAASVRRAVAEGELAAGERLPPAGEVSTVLDVNTNTVLAAYRLLRSEGVVDFRRGRGVRIRHDAGPRASVTEEARRLLDAGRRHGYTTSELLRLLEQLAQEAR